MEGDKELRLLFLGDVVGRAARNMVYEKLPQIRERHELDFVIVNGENAAGGYGITEVICQELLDAGADVVTTGNHVWDQREALVFIERQEAMLRPINFPEGTPGRGANIYTARNGAKVLVINAIGRIFMDSLDDPFTGVLRVLEQHPLGEAVDAAVIDFHAEATSEKQGFAYFVDGKASLVVGTHTHAPTADQRILPGGTGFQSDAGMCGDYDSILGMDKMEPIHRFLRKYSSGKFEPAMGEVTLCGLAVEIDDKSGFATSIEPFRTGGVLTPATPSFWPNT